MSYERNDRYYAKHGHGCGRIGCNAEVLRTLNPEQLNAIADMLLYGDIDEVPLDADTVGRFAPKERPDAESEGKLQAIAALVYASNHLAEDIAALR